MKVFVDLDGVVADFDGMHERLFGWRPSIQTAQRIDWEVITKHHPHLFAYLEPMPQAGVLWRGVEELCRLGGLPYPQVLTGVRQDMEFAARDKVRWVHANISGWTTVLCCNPADKSKCCQPGDIIIDDWAKYREAWLEAGGHWILHTSVTKSLADLRDLLASQDT